jgi:hypothetical protein
VTAGNDMKVEYKSLVIIWLALLISQVLFFGLILFAKPGILTADAPDNPLGNKPLIALAFAVAAVAFFILSIVLSRQHMRRAVVDHDQGCVQTGLVLGCALSEVSSVLGIVLAFVWNYHYFFLWILLGTLGILINFPRKSFLDAAAPKK